MGRTEDRILADPTDAPYGVGWWAPHPGTSRRILMSDLLYACTASVSTNLVGNPSAGIDRRQGVSFTTLRLILEALVHSVARGPRGRK